MQAPPRSHVVLAAGGSGIVVSSFDGNLSICGSVTNITGVISAAVFYDNVSQAFFVGIILLSKTVIVLRLRQGAEELTWAQIAKHELPKRLAAISFAESPRCVVVADTIGDVYRLPVEGHCDLKNEEVQEKHLLLGHFSLLTDLCIGDGCLVTSDRDSRIRISRFPDAFVIENFLLGHSAFVTCVSWTSENKMLSGGGDGTLRLWDVDSGKATVFHFSEHDKQSDVIVTSVNLCPAENDIFAVLLHEKPQLYIMSFSSKDSVLSVICEFGGEGQDMTITGACFDGDGILWVSRTDTVVIEGYKVIRKAGGSAELHRHSTCNVLQDAGGKTEANKSEKADSGKEAMAKTAFVRSQWLSQLRKKPIVENWKGKKRKYADSS